MKEWTLSGQECPKCKKQTEILIEQSAPEEPIYELGERCKTCKWEILFDGGETK